jgi:SAM-dependent methyltransferase
VTEEDRSRWDERWAQLGPAELDAVAPPSFLAPHADLIPTSGTALDIACGRGLGAVWLAGRGLHVWGFDVSEVAIAHARDLAQRSGFRDFSRFDTVDLDEGLPAGAPVEVILCNKFRDRRLDRALIERLAPGGLLAIATFSEVGATPGRYRAMAGELPAVFAELHLVAAGESDGLAWLLARRCRDPMPRTSKGDK